MSLRELVRSCTDRGIPGVAAASGLAVGVLVFGPALLGRGPTHHFLAWNLVLAWVPFAAAIAVELFLRAHLRVAAVVGGAVWFFFFPNAPYLVSDLTHLRGDSATPWLDLTRLVAFGWAGCLLAVASLRIIHLVVAQRAGAFVGWLVVAAASVGGGVGIVLGRFSRLNSWQMLTAPSTVIDETVRLAGSRQAVAVSVFFMLLVAVLYVAQSQQRAWMSP